VTKSHLGDPMISGKSDYCMWMSTSIATASLSDALLSSIPKLDASGSNWAIQGGDRNKPNDMGLGGGSPFATA